MTKPALRHPGRWIWLVLLVPAAIGISRLGFDTDIFNLLPRDLRVVQGLRAYQDNFSSARELIISIRTRDADSAESAARLLADALREKSNLVATVTWQPPWREHPEQAAELIAFLWLNANSAAVSDLTNRLAPQNVSELLTTARDVLGSSLSPDEIARLSYDPFGVTRLPVNTAGAVPSFAEGQQGFSSPDGTFRLLFVKAASDLTTYRQCQGWLKSIRGIVDRKNLTGAMQAKVGFTGRPVFVAEAAAGMQHDISGSVGGTALIITILFWLAHRCVKPLLWLLVLLGLILTMTLAMGGLIFGQINIISLGFAAILLGLAVDYALVDYQEALDHPQLSIPEVRGIIAPGVIWAAATTIAAFLVLNLGGLPGLAQLGTLVATGTLIAAVVMLFEYLPPLFPGRNRDLESPAPGRSEVRVPNPPRGTIYLTLAKTATGGLLALCIAVLAFGFPRVDATAGALRPLDSEAYAVLEEIKSNLSQDQEPLWLVIEGRDEDMLLRRLKQADPLLQHAVSNGVINSFALPIALLPDAENQRANKQALAALHGRLDEFREAAQTNGFSERSLALLEHVLTAWQGAAQTEVFWPQNDLVRWISEKTLARTGTNCFALGMVQPAASPIEARLYHGSADQDKSARSLSELETRLANIGARLSGWELLGAAVYGRVRAHMWQVVSLMFLLVSFSLWCAFRRCAEVLLSATVLALSFTTLLAFMRIAGWSWNLMNLLAIPLIFGTGVDYGIFIQLALRRNGGNVRAVWRSVGKALFLCGATTIAGFGSLAWSNNAGMCGFGRVCALGVAVNMVISILLLPAWWCATVAQGRGKSSKPQSPSSLYQANLWRIGLILVRVLPLRLCHRLGQALMYLYWATTPHRREVVKENLMPALNNDAHAARNAARRLFLNFGVKIADLLRFEAGLSVKHLFGRSNGWDHFVEAQKQKRGVLLLTMHLGNWEYGAHCVTQEGYNLQVLTLAEPGSDFTELRQVCRARWNVETLVVRNDPFAFVEVIRRLEAGANVALLIDRPPLETAVTVELFGKPFAASIAAAELARASGCILLPTFLPWEGTSYGAYILPPIQYNRPALREREARKELTQNIISTFEPIIRQHLDQWYHFVPLWPESDSPSPSKDLGPTPSPHGLRTQNAAKKQT